MNTNLFEQFSSVIRTLSVAELNGASSLNSKLCLARDGNLEVCYAPFEYVNPSARVVIVGITPGRTQMLNALKESRRQLDNGADPMTSLIAAKQTGAFSGPMRPKLIELLDSIGIQRWLGIRSCDELFGAAAHLLQTASVLRYPVFIDGGNYNGTPNMTKHPLLREQLISYFGEDVKALPNAVFLPLGDKVSDALHFLAKQGLLDSDRILSGLPHPSPANAERIAYFLGKKRREELSIKTNPAKLELARANIIHQVQALA